MIARGASCCGAHFVLAAATPQELANSCWGLALSDYYDAAFFEAVAERVAGEAAEWKPAGAQLDLPSLLFAFAKLKAEGHDDMLGVAAKKLAPVADKINDWGLCASLWSYQQLDTGCNFLAFRQRLLLEVKRRQLSEEDVEHSRQGPEAWWMDTRQPNVDSDLSWNQCRVVCLCLI